MIEVKIWAEIASTGLFAEDGSYLDNDDINVSYDTWNELQKWVLDYENYSPLSYHKWEDIKDKITELDNRGLNLMAKIKNEIDNPNYTFKYYSEGLCKFLM